MKLPSVYANKIDKKINNNSSCYHEDRHNEVKDLSELKDKFDNNGYVNRLRVELEMGNGHKIDTKLVLCKNNYFIDINNDKIHFDDIKDYKIKK